MRHLGKFFFFFSIPGIISINGTKIPQIVCGISVPIGKLPVLYVKLSLFMNGQTTQQKAAESRPSEPPATGIFSVRASQIKVLNFDIPMVVVAYFAAIVQFLI